jgi:hypothetical protein
MAVVGPVFARVILGHARADASDSGGLVCPLKRRHIGGDAMMPKCRADKMDPSQHAARSSEIDAQACVYERHRTPTFVIRGEQNRGANNRSNMQSNSGSSRLAIWTLNTHGIRC